jgi:3-deoxy-manno-octulosonate cytidylyltransferase (CMP-KDO synthetase)
VVKVVCRADGDAAYFSRAPIPYARDHFASNGANRCRQIFRPIATSACTPTASFWAFSGLTVAPTEHFESLEQLRALWHGYRISVTLLMSPAPGVDTPEDAERMRKLFDRAINCE